VQRIKTKLSVNSVFSELATGQNSVNQSTAGRFSASIVNTHDDWPSGVIPAAPANLMA
jgi:hypothetical protein